MERRNDRESVHETKNLFKIGMSAAMSAGCEQANSWACCLGLFSSGPFWERQKWRRLTRCSTQQWYDICLFGLQSPSINHLRARHWSSPNLCSPPMQADIFCPSHAAAWQCFCRHYYGSVFPSAPLFLAVSAPCCVVVTKTQFVLSLLTESSGMAQSQNTQRNCNNTVSLFADMPPVFACQIHLTCSLFFDWNVQPAYCLTAERFTSLFLVLNPQ